MTQHRHGKRSNYGKLQEEIEPFKNSAGFELIADSLECIDQRRTEFCQSRLCFTE